MAILIKDHPTNNHSELEPGCTLNQSMRGAERIRLNAAEATQASPNSTPFCSPPTLTLNASDAMLMPVPSG